MNKPLILMYHRVADVQVDHWGLAVSLRHFEQHLSILRRTRRPMALTEFVYRLDNGTLPQDAVAVTFDDGYVDNLTAGLPLLADADVPATVFLATGFLDRPEPFWWDELAELALRQTHESFEIEIDRQFIRFEPGPQSMAGNGGEESDHTPADGRAVLDLLYEPLRRLGDDERRAAMGRVRAVLSTLDDYSSMGRAMTSEEVRSLAAGGLVAIGAHSATHPVLSRLDAAACRREVVQSKLACEAIMASAVTAFCYPYGEFNATVRNEVKDAGFTLACSTRRGAVPSASDVLALPRIYIPDQDGDAFDQRIRWASDLEEG